MTKEQIANEALQATAGRKRSGVAVTMGGGKTHIGLLHMARIYHPEITFLVVASKRSVFDVWEQEAKKFSLEYLLPHITYTTYRSLSKQPHLYHAVYLDECHSLLYVHDRWLSQYTGVILGMTGTPPRFRNSEKGAMVAKYCPIVYTYLTDEAIADGLLNDYRIIVHHLLLGNTKNVPMKNNSTGGTWFQSEESAYLYWHKKITALEDMGKKMQEDLQLLHQQQSSGSLTTKYLTQKEQQLQAIKNVWNELGRLRIQRMKTLMALPGKVAYCRWMLYYIRNKVMIFANTKEQADELCPHSFHSDNPFSDDNLELFKKGDIRQLASILQLNEGINIEDLREGIILHAYSNERKSPQRIGRLLRLNPEEISITHVLCYDGTIDEKWIKEALQDFDQEKIFHYYPGENGLFDTHGELVPRLEVPWGWYHPPIGYQSEVLESA